MKIPLIKPYISQKVKDKVIEVLDSGYLTEGPVTKEFENEFRQYIGCTNALAVTSCTTGLEIALRALKIGSGDEVIVPDYTYPATASVVNIVGAKAVIVDIDKSNMLIDYDEIEKNITNNTKAIIPVSLFGNPLDYERLNEIKNKYNLFIIEDAACSIGAGYGKQKVGEHADISVFSLHPRKFITTGEGGLIATNSKKLADWMYSYKHFGMNINPQDRKGVEFDIIGTNYKLSNIQAAIGLEQLREIDLLLNRRRELANNYLSLLKDNNKVSIPHLLENADHSYQSFCIHIDNRDDVMKKMREIGIEVQIGTYSLHMHKAFNDNKDVVISGDMKNSKFAFEHTLTLPLFHELTFEQQEMIVRKLSEFLI